MDFTNQQVTDALTARQVSTQCPRCTTPEAFDVSRGLIYLDHIGGQNVRTASLVCRRCGYLSLHSLAALGLEDQ